MSRQREGQRYVGSDHYLVLMKIKLKARRVKNSRHEKGRHTV